MNYATHVANMACAQITTTGLLKDKEIQWDIDDRDDIKDSAK